MRITVIGMGHGGSTIGADLSLKGHEVTLLKTSNKLHNEHYEYVKKHKKINIKRNNVEQNAIIHNVTTDFKEAILSAELIIIYIQTNYHQDVINRMSAYLKSGQVLLFEPGYLSTAYCLGALAQENITIVEAESSPIDCRIIKPGFVEVLFENVRNPIGIYPRVNETSTLKLLSKLGYNFTLTKSVVEAALHNPNLIVHTIGAIMSIPRIEYTNGEYWMYKEVFTPSVWNIVEKLDNEKNTVLERMGLQRLSYVDACKFRNSQDLSIDSKKVFFNYAQNSSPKGPNIVNARYITEDVPEGLVLLESLGKLLDVDTPTCSSLIDLASAALKADYRSAGRTIEKLGEKNLKMILED